MKPIILRPIGLKIDLYRLCQPVAAQIKEPVIVLMRDGSGDFGLMKGFRPAQGEIESFRDQRLGVGRYETRYRDVMRRRAEAEGIGGVEEGAKRSVQATCAWRGLRSRGQACRSPGHRAGSGPRARGRVSHCCR